MQLKQLPWAFFRDPAAAGSQLDLGITDSIPLRAFYCNTQTCPQTAMNFWGISLRPSRLCGFFGFLIGQALPIASSVLFAPLWFCSRLLPLQGRKCVLCDSLRSLRFLRVNSGLTVFRISAFCFLLSAFRLTPPSFSLLCPTKDRGFRNTRNLLAFNPRSSDVSHYQRSNV